jgi:hypothetical protein
VLTTLTAAASLLATALAALALTSGLLILLTGLLLLAALSALLTRILILTAHEATPLRGTIPREANNRVDL